MSSRAKNYVIVVLAATTLSSGLIAWNQAQRLDTLQNELVRASASATVIKPKPAPSPAGVDADTPARHNAATAAEIEPATPVEEVTQRQRSNRPNLSALMASPEFAKAMNLQQRAGLDARYATLFKQLNLPTAELEKLKNLLVERQTARMDVMNAARENGLNPRENRDEISKLVADSQAEVDANIKATLGDARFNQYQRFETTQPQRNLVSQLDQRLSYSSTPLSSTQSDFLVTALASGNPPNAGSQTGSGNWGGGNRATISDTVLQQAQNVLSPDQLAALKQLQIEQQAQQKVREMMRAGGEQGTATKPVNP